MYIQHRNDDFIALRKKFPQFSFDSFAIHHEKDKIDFAYSFSISDRYFFEPKIIIPIKPFFKIKELNPEHLNILAFHVGMIELISYWKASCSPLIKIKPFLLLTASKSSFQFVISGVQFTLSITARFKIKSVY